MNIKKDDKVIVLSGKDKGKQGKVLSADPKAIPKVAESIKEFGLTCSTQLMSHNR